MKKWLCMLLAAAMLVAGCGAPADSTTAGQTTEAQTTQAPAQTGRTGVYYGEAMGFGGTVSAYVFYENDKIVDVVLEGLKETIGKGSVVIDELPAKIVAANGIEVEGISGATMTSDAVKKAVEAAMNSTEIVEYNKDQVTIAYKAGTYTASAFGHNNPTTLEVTFSDSKIESITITEDKSDVAMKKAVGEAMPARIIEAQSLNVDIVSGATESSNAVINAVADCVVQASSQEVADALRTMKKDDVAAVNEEYTVDLVVIGGGGSGLTTAYSAASQGHSVLVMEAADILGGMTNVCGGGSLAIGTEMQKAAELYDSEEQIKELLAAEYDILFAASSYQAKSSFIHAYVDALSKSADWASEAGIPISAQRANSARLGDKGFRFDTIIDKMVNTYGTTILTGTRGTSLIVEDGQIAGAIGTNASGGTVTVHAKAVVLATGGFLANEEMVKEYIPGYTEYFDNWSGSTRYQGDGVLMAWEAGAAVGPMGAQPHDSKIPEEIHNLGLSTHSPCAYSNAAYYPSLWIDDAGYRFINEDIGNISPEMHGAVTMQVGHYYTILDQTLIDKLENEGSPIGGWMSMKGATPGLSDQIEQVLALGNGEAYKADTLEELAEMMGIDPQTLVDTVTRYNEMVAAGEDTDFGKRESQLIDSLENGPFYALENVSRMLAAYGGLIIDENMNVMAEDGTPIEGLYAVGLDAGYFMGDVYSVTTVTAGFAITSGYMAGNSVDAYLDGLK